jgi:hypothetical protein
MLFIVKLVASTRDTGEKWLMEASVATLLLITASVIISCVVVDYAVNVIQQTMNTTNLPQLDRIRNLEQNLLSQTDGVINGTLSDFPSPTP